MVFTNEIANSNSRKLWFGALWMLLGTLFILCAVKPRP